MAATQNSKLRSLRFRLPAFLSLLAIGGGLAMYVFETRIHKAEFEANFNRDQMFRATWIQADVDRWVQRDDLDMVQSIFAELAVIPELKTALFLDATNTVLASTRREDLRRPLDIGHLGLDKLDPRQLLAAMQTARQTMRGSSLFTSDRNGVIACFPTSLPLQPGGLEVRRGGVVLVVYDLRLEKAASLRHLQTDFLIYFAGILFIALALGISLHFLITRRLARLKSAMTDFAAGKAVVVSPSKVDDEISDLGTQFNEMATTIGREMGERRRMEEALQNAAVNYRIVADNTYDWEFWLNPAGEFIYISPSCKRITGYEADEFRADPGLMGRIVHQDDRSRFAGHSHDMVQQMSPGELEYRIVRPDGAIRWIDHMCQPVFDEKGSFLGTRGSNRDITGRKRAEEALRRLNRELRAISNCNQILMRAADEQTILNDICRIVCDEAGYRMAWVGFAENDEARTVRPVAWAGIDDGYLAQASITWADTERGSGPTGTAIRSGVSVCIQDFTTDPQAAPWRENALQRGYRSNIALPLKDERGEVFGAFTIYSTEPNAFTPDEIRLMEELAGDLAFGITVLRGRIERQQALEKIAHLAAIVESSDDAIIGKALDETVLSWNRGAERIYGYTADEIVGRSISVLVPPGLKDELAAIMERLKRGERVEHLETTRVRKDGQIIHVALTVSPIKDACGQIVGASTIARDITGSKQAEEALRESEEKYRRIVETASEGIWTLGTDLLTTFVNARMVEMTGYPAEELIGRPFTDVMFPEDVPDHHRRLKARTEGISENYERRIRRKDGKTVWTYISATPVFDEENRFHGTLAMLTDITGRKQAEEEIRKLNAELEQRVQDRTRELAISEERMRLFFEHQLVGTAITSPEKGWVQVNGKLCEMLGYSREELARLTWAELTCPEDLAAEVAQFERLLKGEIEGYMLEKRFVRKDGGIVFTDLAVGCVRRPDRSVDYVLSLVEDTTDRKRTEAALQESQRSLEEERYLLHTLANNIPDAIYFKDVQSRFVRINRAQARRFGLSDPAQAVGKTDFDFFTEEHARPAYEDEQAILRSGQPVVDKEEKETWPDGRVGWVMTTKMPLHDQEGRIVGTFGISSDITGRKRAEESIQKLNEELRQRAVMLEAANKELESFSYSVSHDLRAPLRSIDGFSKALLEDYADKLDDEGKENLRTVRAASQRMAQLIDDILQLSRISRSQPRLTPVDLSALAATVADDLKKEEPERRVEFVIEPECVAFADGNLMRAVLENLMGNAWKFTGKKTDAKIEFGRTTRDGVPAFFVRDNGVGFDMAYADKLFGAFQRLHSTADFPGTGIGLATVQRIIHRHGGRVWAEGEVGHGATFFFSLPPAT